MKIKEIVNKLKKNEELTDKEKNFLINKLTSKNLIKNEKYNSFRCPNCNGVITYKSAHYCIQCGQKISFYINNML